MRRIAALLTFSLVLVLGAGFPASAQTTSTPTTSTATDTPTGNPSQSGAIIDGEEDEATPPSTINTATTVAEPEGEEETNEPSALKTEELMAAEDRNVWFWLPLVVAVGAGALLLAYAASTLVVNRERAGGTAA